MLAREVSFRRRPEEHAETRDAGTTLKLGGGGKRLAGSNVGNPYPKIKLPDLVHFFGGGHKFTCKNKPKYK